MSSSLLAYCSLTKPRLLVMVLVVTACGFVLGCKAEMQWESFFVTMLGTAFSFAGGAVLNNYLEREIDSKMTRTMTRAIPSGQISPANALGFGLCLVLCGTGLLAFHINLLTGFLALLTAFLYVLIYTPLKRITWLNTVIGAIPGALPPMGGWTAATNDLSTWAPWLLFLILFIWQYPHFFSIAWVYKQDYKTANLKMLPALEPEGRLTFTLTILFSVLLIPISALPTFLGISGNIYFVGAVVLGLLMLFWGLMLSVSKSVQHAKNLLRASIIYLPLVLILMVVDGKF